MRELLVQSMSDRMDNYAQATTISKHLIYWIRESVITMVDKSLIFYSTMPIKDNILTFDASNSIFNHSKILERLYKVETLFDLKVQYELSKDKTILVQEYLGITQSWYTAVHCFAIFMYGPAIIFSSIAVECALNHDLRLDEERLRQRDEWLNLNYPNVRLAKQSGIPIEKLLSDNESLDKGQIQFIERRNKIAHGDYEAYRQIFSQSTGMSPTEDDALDQIKKSREFIIAWCKFPTTVRVYEPNLPIKESDDV